MPPKYLNANHILIVLQELDLERQREVMRQWTEELAELAEAPLKARSDM